jgi:16S rRNA C1402 N4-methylase RsmH
MSFLKLKSTTHYPVLHKEISLLAAEYLKIVEDTKPSPQMFDGTFGGGGHSIKLLNEHKNLKILGTDMDLHVLN